ncbi:hypothetical protein N7471_010279 [Penicillium samsonianum]|uniref:uncharacterized protein n=1 Tax=Penicillium samsonianum TaxID=1882272 RepID=UPI0025469EAB|nr:uncharacterized protein N7471_010279 [Penicillium samsonianum]KAJ6125786.1 hypothetical protein N7471_010279 [Penicillium samsonianum]
MLGAVGVHWRIIRRLDANHEPDDAAINERLHKWVEEKISAAGLKTLDWLGGYKLNEAEGI